MKKIHQANKLLRAIRAIPEPRHYYTGLQPATDRLPVNILLFPRLSRAYMERWHSNPTSHHRHVLIVALKSAGTIQLEHMRIRMTPGMAVMVQPFQLHRAFRFDQEKIAWLYISFETADANALEPLRDAPIALPPPAWEHLLNLASDFARTGDKPASLRTRISLRLALLLNELAAAEPTSAVGSAAPHASAADLIVEEACRFISEHLAERVHVADVAAHVGLSESHLRLLFRRTVRTPLGKYHRAVQLTRAAMLATLSEMSVGEIAQRCGFESIYSFSRAFKREMNLSPLQYRKRFGPTARAARTKRRRER